MSIQSGAAMSVREAAGLTGTDYRTLTAQLTVNGGDVPSVRVGRRIVIPRDRFLEWLNGGAGPVVAGEPVAERAPVDPGKVAAIVAALVSSPDAVDRVALALWGGTAPAALKAVS